MPEKLKRATPKRALKKQEKAAADHQPHHEDGEAADAAHAAAHHEAAGSSEAHHEDHEAVFPSADGKLEEVKNSDILATAATIAVVGVVVAVISVDLIPGMLIGVAAALLPGVGPKGSPFLKSTFEAGYSAVRKTCEKMTGSKTENVDPIPTPPVPSESRA